MNEHGLRLTRWLGASLLLSSLGCGDGDGALPDDSVPIPAAATLASLQRVSDCDDLLTKIQNDAIAKLKLTAERAKIDPQSFGGGSGAVDAGVALGGNGGGVPTTSDGRDESSSDAPPSAPPTGASDTNTQVAGVDEADFVKVVEGGKGIFLLHGNTLRKLKSWPAAETALVGEPLVIEGSPSEMFVTDQGKAVVFSSVSSQSSGQKPGSFGGPAVDCAFDGPCGGYGYGALKITVANVAGAAPVVERELYYDGSYVSSRRYAGGGSDVVRAVIQADSKFSGLFRPEVDWYDAWGRAYDADSLAQQIDAWAARTIADIRRTTLDDWLPSAEEKQAGGARVALAPRCGDYYVPVAGVADYGLTHVVSLDVANTAAPVGGITILGATSTVYSSASDLVLAQPDYRWYGGIDFGVANLQQTALHVFSLAGATTSYQASGWVPGQLPLRNAQFGIDVASDHTIRIATTGAVRNAPNSARDEPVFWQQHTENYVLALRANGNALSVVGKTPKLGHEGESVYSARFVGDRAYVVTFRQTDPLIVVDLKNPAALAVLGEIEIPGFSEYMHPLDATHLITVGQSGSWGMQLQLFDVSDPARLPAPKVLNLGDGSSSAVSYQHKAFTFFDGILAIPLSGYDNTAFSRGYRSLLKLVRVDASTGFTDLGAIDHTQLYADNGAGVQCGYCEGGRCFDYGCSYAPEVRRGHFVKSDAATFVYSFSHAGVLVNDLTNLTQPIARVGLPRPTFDYGVGGSVRDGGVAGLDGGSSVSWDAGAPMSFVDGGSALP